MPDSDEIDLETLEDTEDEGKLVQFPIDRDRMPEPLLPRPVGRIPSGHPLVRPLIIALILLVIVLAGHFLFTLFNQKKATTSQPGQVGQINSPGFPGSITYENLRVSGWYLDPEREHFMAEDGRRFTHVNAHDREGSPVTGYWRIIK